MKLDTFTSRVVTHAELGGALPRLVMRRSTPASPDSQIQIPKRPVSGPNRPANRKPSHTPASGQPRDTLNSQQRARPLPSCIKNQDDSSDRGLTNLMWRYYRKSRQPPLTLRKWKGKIFNVACHRYGWSALAPGSRLMAPIARARPPRFRLTDERDAVGSKFAWASPFSCWLCSLDTSPENRRQKEFNNRRARFRRQGD